MSVLPLDLCATAHQDLTYMWFQQRSYESQLREQYEDLKGGRLSHSEFDFACQQIHEHFFPKIFEVRQLPSGSLTTLQSKGVEIPQFNLDGKWGNELKLHLLNDYEEGVAIPRPIARWLVKNLSNQVKLDMTTLWCFQDEEGQLNLELTRLQILALRIERCAQVIHMCLNAEGEIRIPPNLSAPIKTLIKQRWGGNTLKGLNQLVVHSLGITRPDGYPNWTLPDSGSPLTKTLLFAFVKSASKQPGDDVTWKDAFEAMSPEEVGEIESVEWEDSIQKIKAMKPEKEAKGEETLTDVVRLNGLIHNVGRANVPRPREKSRNF